MFLSNENNKLQFINLLSTYYLQADGRSVQNSSGDVDTMIVAHPLQYAVQGHEVNVVAEDIDVLVLLMYHWKHNMANIYFLSEANASQKKTMTVWKI